jgi:hypothetical protein
MGTVIPAMRVHMMDPTNYFMEPPPPDPMDVEVWRKRLEEELNLKIINLDVEGMAISFDLYSPERKELLNENVITTTIEKLLLETRKLTNMNSIQVEKVELKDPEDSRNNPQDMRKA